MGLILQLENAHIGRRNFSGEIKTDFDTGKRYFNVYLEDLKLVDDLNRDGWSIHEYLPKGTADTYLQSDRNCKSLDGKELMDYVKNTNPSDLVYYIPVEVKFSPVPPTMIKLINNGVQTVLTEDTIGCLDHVEIENVDLILNGYQWTVNKKSGVKAYLKEIYVTARQGNFGGKYDDSQFMTRFPEE